MHFEPLRNTRFAKMLAGQFISELGSAVTQIALPTIAVLVLHADPLQLGILIALQKVPFPVLGLLVGVWIDRLPRRRVMVAADVLRTIVLSAVPLAAVLNELNLAVLDVVALATGTLTVFFDLAYLSYVPEIVSRDRLRDANSLLQTGLSAANLAGPGLGGLLIQAIGAARAVTVDAGSFLVSFLSLLWMGKDTAQPRPAASEGMLRDLRAGFAHVFKDPVLGYLVTVMGVVITISHISDPNLYPFAYGQLHLTPATLGWALSSAGAGAVIGASISAIVTRRFGAGYVLAVTGAISGTAFVAISFAGQGPGPLFILVPALITLGLMDPINNVTQWSLRQLLTPDHLQGRMNSIFRTVYWGAWPLGSVLGGFVGSAIGSRTAILASGLGFGLASLAFLFGPLRSTAVASRAPQPDSG